MITPRRVVQLGPDHARAHKRTISMASCSTRPATAKTAFPTLNNNSTWGTCAKVRIDAARESTTISDALQSLGRLDEAQAAYDRTLEIDPDNHAVRHMLHALRGETVAKPPAEFVSRLFDRYAPVSNRT